MPFEALKASARTRARLAAELTEVCASLGAAKASTLGPVEADALLGEAQQRLTTLKRKARALAAAEAASRADAARPRSSQALRRRRRRRCSSFAHARSTSPPRWAPTPTRCAAGKPRGWTGACEARGRQRCVSVA